MRLPMRIGVAAIAVGTLTGAALTGTADASATARHTLPGSVPPWAHAAAYHGKAAGTRHVGFRVYLGWRNAAQAVALAKSVSTPGSSSYGHYLTAAQFRAQFAPTNDQVAAVQQWLRSSGFSVVYTPANHHYVAAEGTIAQADKAFATTLGNYAYKGKTLLAPNTALSVPASLPAVTGVIGLDGTARLVHLDKTPPPSPGFRNAQPCSDTWGQKTTATDQVAASSDNPLLGFAGGHLTVARTSPTTLPDYAGAARPYAPCGYTPDQLRAAYGLSSTETGAGQTVAIIDAYASPTIVQDANTYFSRHGGYATYPKLDSSNFTQVVAPGTYNRAENPAQDPQGWWGEETLDVEAVHSTAPDAHIVYVGAPNNYQDLDAALNHVVDRHLASIVTNSYGWSGEDLPAGFIKPVYDTMVEAAATGVGLYFSSGDSGDETGGNAAATPSADWPASSPLVTAVGGTSLEWDGTTRTEYGWETQKATLATDGSDTDAGLSWNTPAYLYGSGGGISRLFARPWYQDAAVAGSGVDSVRSSSGRVVPDVSMVADPTTGMLVGQTQSFSDGAYYDEYRIGGTSLASPLFAGVMADVQAQRGTDVGFANPLLYASSAYDDVTPAPTGEAAIRVDYANGENAAGGYLASVRTIGFEGLTIHTGAGYDDVTGLGTPAPGFVTTLAGTAPLTK